jgi:hypothetical protein
MNAVSLLSMQLAPIIYFNVTLSCTNEMCHGATFISLLGIDWYNFKTFFHTSLELILFLLL